MLAFLIGGLAVVQIKGVGAEDSPSAVEAASLINPSLRADKQAILADGIVTRDEYVGAVSSAHECATGAGLRVTEPKWEASGRLVFELGPYATHEELTAHSSAFNRCLDENVTGIDMVWRNSLPQNQVR